MPQHLTSVPGATIVSGIAEAVLTLLRSDDAAAAAWRGSMSSPRSRRSSGGPMQTTRVAELPAFMIERGATTGRRVRHWTEILCDDALAVARARGETPHDENHPLTKAGLALADRLTLCESASREQPPKGAVVVWLAHSNASLRSTHRSDEWHRPVRWRALGRRKGAALRRSWDRPPELDDPTASISTSVRPKTSFSCVSILATVRIMTARARARQIAESLPALVAASSGWRLMDGEVCVR